MTATTTALLQVRPKAIFHLSDNAGMRGERCLTFFKCRAAGYTLIAEWGKGNLLIQLFLLLKGAIHVSLNDRESDAWNGEIAQSI